MKRPTISSIEVCPETGHRELERCTNRRRQSSPALTLALVSLAFGPVSLVSAQGASFDFTGAMNIARDGHTATLLANGKVLVAGGGNGTNLSSAELYDPGSGTWSLTGSMGVPRSDHTLTLLRDGRVLAAGGWYLPSGLSTSAELFDPATGLWSATGAMIIGRGGHTATLLADGRVLIAGGAIDYRAYNSAEIYDPASGTWSTTASMNTGRQWHTASLLRDGRVLVAGGFPDDTGGEFLRSTEVFDPTTESWTATGDMVEPRTEHTATLLPDGKVLLAGGYYFFHLPFGLPDGTIAIAELYDPVTGTCVATGPMATARADHTANLLLNGQVLITGGVEEGRFALSSAELYDPPNGTWSPAGAMGANRWLHTATLLTNGEILIAAGTGISNLLSSAELYNPGAPTATFLAVTAPANAITPTSALLQGTVFLNNQAAAAWFEYGTTTNYTSMTPVIPIDYSNGTALAVSSPISGLFGEMLYHFRLVATNDFATSFGADLTFTAREVPLVVNGGFETGDFTGWSETGYSDDNYVGSDPLAVRSGIYGAAIGPTDSRGYLSQSIPTTPGQPYLISFWLDSFWLVSPDGRSNEVGVTWDGTSLFHGANFGQIGWTNMQFQVLATKSFTQLRFGAQVNGSYFGLDDVSVVAIPSPDFLRGGLAETNGTLTLTWGSLAGVVYQLQFATNLTSPVWYDLGLPIRATDQTTTFEDNVGSEPQRFYRVVLSLIAREASLVVNGGFEMGDFTGWTQTGYTDNNGVLLDPLDIHSGNYGASLGPIGTLGYLSQAIATRPAQSYLISFWLDSPDGRTPNEVSVTWNGTNLFDGVNLGAIGWTNMQFQAVATRPFTLLQLGFRNDAGFFGLDDVSVMAVSPLEPLAGQVVTSDRLAPTRNNSF